MYRILVTGEKSKLGLAFVSYMRACAQADRYEITAMSVRGEKWKEADFGQYDVILHCAGIFRAPAQDYAYYEEVNVKLTRALAEKAVQSGVRQFIYLSTMDIYRPGLITKETAPDPQSLYGRSKWEAEQALHAVLDDSEVKLAIVRCCPVIVKNAESSLEGYLKAFRLPIFPVMLTDEKRSILHVDTLCELIRLIVEEGSAGVFFPQDLPPLSVGEILRIIKQATGRKTVLLKLPRFLWLRSARTARIYGNWCYAEELSDHFGGKYRKMTAKEAIHSLFS